MTGDNERSSTKLPFKGDGEARLFVNRFFLKIVSLPALGVIWETSLPIAFGAV